MAGLLGNNRPRCRMNPLWVGVNSPFIFVSRNKLRHNTTLFAGFDVVITLANRIGNQFIIVKNVQHVSLQAANAFTGGSHTLFINDKQKQRGKNQRNEPGYQQSLPVSELILHNLHESTLIVNSIAKSVTRLCCCITALYVDRGCLPLRSRYVDVARNRALRLQIYTIKAHIC